MFRNLAIIASFVAAASAFQPVAVNRVNRAAASSSVQMEELGVLPPLGLFDPLNLMEDKEGFARRRAVEIKHGRIAMVAFVGMLVQELGITFPGTTQITDPEERTKKLNIEIQNGRAAMLGLFGCMCHDMVDSINHHFYPITGN